MSQSFEDTTEVLRLLKSMIKELQIRSTWQEVQLLYWEYILLSKTKLEYKVHKYQQNTIQFSCSFNIVGKTIWTKILIFIVLLIKKELDQYYCLIILDVHSVMTTFLVLRMGCQDNQLSRQRLWIQ